MEVERQDVTEEVDSSATQDVAEESSPQKSQESQESVQEPVQEDIPAPQGQEEVDETGVPWKNRAMEWKRKTEELADSLPKLLDEKLAQFQKPQQQEYTIEQLEAFAERQPEYAAWCKGEIRRLERQEQAKVVQAEISRWREEETKKQQQVQAFQYVMANHPDAFIKDAQGRPTGQWNPNSPVTRMMTEIMKDPEISKSPRGMIAAADLAAYYISKQQQPKLKQQQARVKAELGNLQKKTLTEGGGKSAQSVPEHRSALDRLKQTGSTRDATAALDAMLRAHREKEE